MKSLTSSVSIVIALTALAMNLHSQTALPKTPIDQLKLLKAKNIEIIEQQKQTLLKLDEMQKQAEQIRFMAARS